MMQRIASRNRTLDSALTRAWNAESKGEVTLAEALVLRILNEYPDNSDARLIQARIWARTGRIESAIPVFRALLEADPTFDAARIALIGALFLLNSYNEGVDHLLFVVGRSMEEEKSTSDTIDNATGNTEAILASLWQSYKNHHSGWQEAGIQGKDLR